MLGKVAFDLDSGKVLDKVFVQDKVSQGVSLDMKDKVSQVAVLDT